MALLVGSGGEDGGGDDRPDYEEVFHRLNSVLPEEQEVVSIDPETAAGRALQIMREHGFSQLPVVSGDIVLGAFSFRSFALSVPPGGHIDPLALPVSEFLEEREFARPQSEFKRITDALDRDGCVFVGSPDGLVAVATTVDVLRYLLSVANVYVLLQEIELALRALLRIVAGSSQPAAWMHESLTRRPEQEQKPQFEEMSFGEYMMILEKKTKWAELETAFGSARPTVIARFRKVNELRNVAFHFKREMTAEDHQALSAAREWLLVRLRILDQRRKGGR